MANLAESVYQRLKNAATSKKRPVQETLHYYAMERFLYRLGISSYQDRFYLKGGLMLMVWDPLSHRTTVDIDLLARTDNSIENIARIIREICLWTVEPDGMVFNVDTISVTESQVVNEYTGLSVKFKALLFRAMLSMRIDIGFSDKILPKPENVTYPVILDFLPPKLKGYTPETMIAEKLDAIIRLGLANTRMKDFFDIWVLLRQFQMTPEQVLPVTEEIFRQRRTPLKSIPETFSPRFYSNPKTMERWANFLNSIEHRYIAMEDVVTELIEFFGPIFAQIRIDYMHTSPS